MNSRHDHVVASCCQSSQLLIFQFFPLRHLYFNPLLLIFSPFLSQSIKIRKNSRFSIQGIFIPSPPVINIDHNVQPLSPAYWSLLTMGRDSRVCTQFSLCSRNKIDLKYNLYLTFLYQMLDVINPMEIISLVGTLSGGGHLHVGLSDYAGKMVGGHLLELVVDTTVEVVIGDCSSLSFTRTYDDSTGFHELQVSDR